MEHISYETLNSGKASSKCLSRHGNTKRYVSIFMGWNRNNNVSSVLKRILPSGKVIGQNSSSFHTSLLASLAPFQR